MMMADHWQSSVQVRTKIQPAKIVQTLLIRLLWKVDASVMYVHICTYMQMNLSGMIKNYIPKD